LQQEREACPSGLLGCAASKGKRSPIHRFGVSPTAAIYPSHLQRY
jgi:hypothetical protein